jgi:uncharacterized circularly permuted ATP-grasp superfamily protein
MADVSLPPTKGITFTVYADPARASRRSSRLTWFPRIVPGDEWDASNAA